MRFQFWHVCFWNGNVFVSNGPSVLGQVSNRPRWPITDTGIPSSPAGPDALIAIPRGALFCQNASDYSAGQRDRNLLSYNGSCSCLALKYLMIMHMSR